MALSIIRQVMYALSVRISNINTPGQITFKGELLLFLAVLQVLTESRHVRVHHVDKSKDDPELRRVLSQRPEGSTRGRRRRTTAQ
jgi:hypothetical protein